MSRLSFKLELSTKHQLKIPLRYTWGKEESEVWQG
jgi:hypothetical protein